MKKNFYFLISLVFTIFQSSAQVVLDPSLAPFYHGVASGDPTANSVIIWTRITDTTAANIPVSWRMATDTAFLHVVASGSTFATSAHDFTVKVDVTGLTQGKWYYYQFTALNKHSLTGRTRTMYGANNTVDSLRFAVVSCANYESGFYNAYEAIKQRNDIDAVIFLGDYIYEYGQGEYDYNATANRHTDPAHEAVTLADYRARHSLAKLDPQLRHLHQQYPVICIWDDHEVANDAWKNGAGNHSPPTEGKWKDRRAAGLSTYVDWMPVRQPNPTGNPLRLYRKFTYGKLMDLYLLDTRFDSRDKSVTASDPTLNDTARTMISINQRNWLASSINAAAGTWQVIGQQIMMAPLQAFGIPLNMDQWDGFPAERNRVYNTMQLNSNKNFAVLTGDIHSAWANDLPKSGYSSSDRTKSYGVEFITTSVTSPSANFSISQSLVMAFNPEVRYFNNSHGYLLINLTKLKMQGEWYFVNTISQLNPATTAGSAWYVNAGEKFLRQATAFTSRAPSRIFPFAPSTPMPVGPRLSQIDMFNSNLVVLDVYPNPVINDLQIQFYNDDESAVMVSMYDLQGKKVMSQELGTLSNGVHLVKVQTSSLNAGTYQMVIETVNGKVARTIIKVNSNQ